MEAGERKYTNSDITVYWKKSSCIHASTCTNELPEVFDSSKRPWVRMKGSVTDKIIEVVDKCPVDALTWKWNDEKLNEKIGIEHPNHVKNRRRNIPKDEEFENMKSTNLKVIDNGPIIVSGNFILEKGNGVKSKFNGTVSICRCGKTKLQPFCDGSHRGKQTEKTTDR